MVNNTLYHNDSLRDGNGEILLQFDTRNNTIKNNILFANDQGLLIGNPYSQNVGNVVDANLYFVQGGADGEWEWRETLYQGFAAYRSGSGNDAHSFFLDPEFVDPDQADLHLKSTSPAIDAGEEFTVAGDFDVDGEARLRDGRIDIGADEVGAAVIVPGNPSADFNRSGTVDFNDFLLFAGAFGGTDPLYDLDGSGRVDFGDFLLFAASFGK